MRLPRSVALKSHASVAASLVAAADAVLKVGPLRLLVPRGVLMRSFG
jgi:hypothetical protein